MLADMVAMALQNSIAITEKDRQASTDQLTGLYNRTYFNPRFAAEVGSARENMAPLSVLLFDIDHFKKVNDTYGHVAGDSVLRQLAIVVKPRLRQQDCLARVGGEEFAVLLPASDQHAAHILAERMRREVRETFVYEPFELTISVGVACCVR